MSEFEQTGKHKRLRPGIGGGRFDSVPEATTFLLLQTLCGDFEGI